MSGAAVVRVIARLNIGGPAQQAVGVSAALSRRGWPTLLVAGSPDPTEGSMEYLLAASPVRFLRLPVLRRALHPVHDLAAWWALLLLLRRERPQLLHTHTAKAGAVGRAAGLAYRWLTGRPLRMVHTFHGHVLEGYFARPTAGLFQSIERALAAATDCLIAVSDAVRDDLIRRRVAPPSKIRVVPLGLPLGPLLALPPPPLEEGPLRVGIVGRLVPIKQHTTFLQAVRQLRDDGALDGARFSVIGDGPLRAPLEQEAQRLGLADHVTFTGWRSDLPAVYGALDVVCLTSRHEGTPVALIEALAAARAVVASDVGGVGDVLRSPGAPREAPAVAAGAFLQAPHGLLIRPEDPRGLAAALRRLAARPDLRQALGAAGRAHVARQYPLDRLVEDLDRLYRELVTA